MCEVRGIVNLAVSSNPRIMLYEPAMQERHLFMDWIFHQLVFCVWCFKRRVETRGFLRWWVAGRGHYAVTSAELQSVLVYYRRTWIHTELPVFSVSYMANQMANVCFTIQESHYHCLVSGTKSSTWWFSHNKNSWQNVAEYRGVGWISKMIDDFWLNVSPIRCFYPRWIALYI